ncbi:MAG: glycosyltransferase family 9 protein [Pirellulaceae bacterium]|nr:glycosyltransferase family 9 protein [Pirellulaceae bacterium]
MGEIGDTVMTLPLACALRQHFPDAHIAWAVEKKSAPIVRHHVAINDVIALPEGWQSSPSMLRQTRTVLRQHRFQVAIDCQGTIRTALACRLSGAAKRIGFDRSYANRCSRLLSNVHVTPTSTHLVDRCLELLGPLGVHAPTTQWQLPLSQQARTWAGRWRRTIHSDRLAVLNPGGTLPSKLWQTERFAETACYLSHRYGYQSVAIWRTTSERSMAEKIVDAAEGNATLAPEMDLTHLAAMIETADLYLSGDTGPLHLSVAVGTTSIGLYGSTRPSDSGPYGQTAIAKAYVPHGQTSAFPSPAMRAIDVADVCRVIDKIQAKRAAFIKTSAA